MFMVYAKKKNTITMKRNEINLYLLPQEDVCDTLSKTDRNNLSAIHLGSPVSPWSVLFTVVSSVPRTL